MRNHNFSVQQKSGREVEKAHKKLPANALKSK